jgi:serine/threonine protein kinase/tetratricopeptide (TPR) repeat protein
MNLRPNGAAACPECGTRIETASIEDVGCTVCLLRAGLDDLSQPISADAEDAASADQFGTYTIARHEDGTLWELGRGAMGITFRAVDSTLNRAVALKIIQTDRDAGRAARERFMRGARAAASLRHPNVAAIYHFGIREETGQCFYAMELVEGETLEERVRRTGPLDAPTTIAIAQQVTAALAEAEKRGLVHRDLKPANLMLTEHDGEGAAAAHGHESAGLNVKVIDFGLAKAIVAQADPMSLTQGGFVGTPAFASPEQFNNASLDVRSDIYSLGVTLWFALTGQTPFTGRSVHEIRESQASHSAPTEQLKAARVPRELRALLKTMVAVEPGARPGIPDLRRKLRRCAMRKSRWLLWWSAVFFLIVMAVFSFLWLSRHDSAGRHQEKKPAPAGGTWSLQAQEAYRKGRSLWATREQQAHKQAIEYFEQAIALDPNYAQAYAGLADTYPLIADNDRLIARSEDYAKARAAAKKAIELDPTLAEPHAALGLVAMNYEYDWATAEREYKRAIELNPNYPTGHHWYAEFLITQGRLDESLTEIKRARELDPLSLMIMSDTGKILFYSRRYDEAIDVFHKTVEMDPTFLPWHQWLAQIYHEKARYDEAIAEFKAGDGNGRSPWTISMMARTMAVAGRKAEAEQLFKELLEIRKRRELEPQNFIPVYIGFGEKDEVFALLEKEYEVRSTGLTSLKVNPLYDSLRSDPRFIDLMRRVHLTP